MADGREYHGLVYAATDDAGNKAGNPFKSSRIGKNTGYEAVARRFEKSKAYIKEKGLADMTKRTILAVLQKTYRREEFVRMLHDKGIDTVFRLTDTGRIYGATFIDLRTGCVLNGSRMGISHCRMRENNRYRSHWLRTVRRRLLPKAFGKTNGNIHRDWACSPAIVPERKRRRKPLPAVSGERRKRKINVKSENRIYATGR